MLPSCLSHNAMPQMGRLGSRPRQQDKQFQAALCRLLLPVRRIWQDFSRTSYPAGGIGILLTSVTWPHPLRQLTVSAAGVGLTRRFA